MTATAKKYHLSKETGRPNVCTASIRNCPVGGTHFDNKDDARAAYEASKKSSSVQEPLKKAAAQEPSTSVASGYTPPKRWDELPENPTQGQINAALSYARKNKKFASVSYKVTEESTEDKGYDHYHEDAEPGGYRIRTDFLLATPEGELMTFRITSTNSPELDGYWQYHPDVAIRGGIAAEKKKGQDWENLPDQVYYHMTPEETDPILRYTDGNFNGLTYDHGSASEAARKARELSDLAASKVWAFARAIRLETSKKNLPVNQLMGKANLGNDDFRVRAALAGRKDMPRKAQDVLVKDANIQVRNTLAKRQDLKVAIVKELLEDRPKKWDDPNVRSTTLKHQKLPDGFLRKTIRGSHIDDLKALSESRHLTPELVQMGRDQCKKIGLNPWGNFRNR